MSFFTQNLRFVVVCIAVLFTLIIFMLWLLKDSSTENIDYVEQPTESENQDSKAEDLVEIVNADTNQIIEVNDIAFDMIWVKGGIFTMGYDSKRDGKNVDNWVKTKSVPLREVKLPDYYISKTEVTQKLWHEVMGSSPGSIYNKNCGDCPIENVSWNDCKAFIEKLNKLTYKKFSLPSEAQWEYAARGGAKNANYKYAGSNNIDEVAWYLGNSNKITHPVGQKKPNELGIYDMSGNVGEWCEDDWQENYNNIHFDGSALINKPRGLNRVIRGGSLKDSRTDLHIVFRSYYKPINRGSHVGFRLCLVP
ncbi:MAG: formylglycine-generating enzyme family protein [Bernardetiaceae bacterium]|nr:formylglycine-generating enzyme family protein [Bernardetiaceae bacterium]